MSEQAQKAAEEVKASDFPKGSRVRIRRSELACWVGRGTHNAAAWTDRIGTITGTGRGKECYVKWDGNKSTKSMWPGWLEILELPKDADTDNRELCSRVDDLLSEVGRLWKEIDDLKARQ